MTKTGRASNHYSKKNENKKPKSRSPRRDLQGPLYNKLMSDIRILLNQCGECGAACDRRKFETASLCGYCDEPLHRPPLINVLEEWRALNGVDEASMGALVRRAKWDDIIRAECGVTS